MRNQSGFTLIELMAVMVIAAVVLSVAFKKVNYVYAEAEKIALDSGITEINSREALTWVQLKFSSDGWIDDNTVYSAIDKNLGVKYSWDSVSNAGGKLLFNNSSVSLTRIKSTATSAARWNP